MKNILKNVFIFLISLSVLTAFSSCKNKNEDPKQEEFGQAGVDSEQPREELDPLFALGEKLRETGSYQLTTTVNAPLLNLVSVKTLVDGNVQYTPKSFLIEEEYIEVTADAEYSYTKNDSGNWQKRKIRSFAGSQSSEDEDLIKLL